MYNVVFPVTPTRTRALPYEQVVVEDFTRQKIVTAMDLSWPNGFTPIFQPQIFKQDNQPNKAFYKYLKSALAASGSGGQIRLSLIDADYAVSKDLADEGLFGLAFSGRPRDWKCTASISISNGVKTERKEFEALDNRPLTYQPEVVQEFINLCNERLTHNIAEYLQSF